MSMAPSLIHRLLEDNPDDIRFEFIKKLYLGIMSDDERDLEQALKQRYISLCRGLPSGEVLTLLAAGKYTDFKKPSRGWTYDEWYNALADQCDLNHGELCSCYGDELANKRMIKQIKRGSEPEIFGLTSLGLSILQYVIMYEEDSTESLR